MADENNQDPNTQDPAYRILKNALVDTETRADIWDDFYECASARVFMNRLQRFEIPDSVRDALIAARKSIEPGHRERVVEAIRHLSTLDPNILTVAENHPNLMKHLIEAAKRESED